MTDKNISSDWQETKDQLYTSKPGARAEVEEENVSITFSILEFNLMKIASQLPMLLNLNRPKICQRCRQIRRSYSLSYRRSFQNYFDIINAGKALSPTSFDPKEVNFGSLHMLDGTFALLSITSETLTDSCICKCVKQQRRIQSVSNMSNLSFQYSDEDQLGNVVKSSSTRWAFDSVDTILRRKTLRRFPPFVDSVPPDVIRQASSPCHSKTSEFTASTSSTRSENSEAVQVQDRSKTSGMKYHHNRLPSNLSVISSSSDSSGLCTEPLLVSALLYCFWDGNIPMFLLSVDDGRGGIFVARPAKIKCPVDKALDYVYIFHLLEVNRMRSLNHATGNLCFVGRMKVSNSLCLDSRRTKFMESQFVLFGAKTDHSSERQSFKSNTNQGNVLSKKLVEIFRLNYSSRKSINSKFSTSSEFENLQDLLLRELRTLDGNGCRDYFGHDFLPTDELSAIIVKDYEYDSTNLAAYSGWGLKFLQKADSHEDSSRCYTSEVVGGTEGPSKTVNVIIPAGYHGGSVIKSSCPSTLIERWMLKGHCDCGGWDSGCPLKVFCDSSKPKNTVKQEHYQDTTFELFTEGSKQDKPTLKLVNVAKDVYLINFQPTLSALQCFSISVAVIHSRTPDLRLKL